MKNILLISSIIIFACSTSIAQITFQKTYGGPIGDYGTCGRQTTDGGYIISGFTYSFGAGNTDVYLIKTNSTGDTLWTKTYGSTNGEAGNSVQQTTDGGYIIAGGTYLIKTNNAGDTMWTKSIDVYNASSIKQTSDGGYIIAGYYGFGFSSYYLSLTKTDSIGTPLWSELISTVPWQSCLGYDVQQTTDGGYIAIGTINAGGARVCLVKTDTNGNVLWLKIYGGTVSGEGWSVQLTNDNGYIIAGWTGFGAGYEDIYLLKTDSSGSVLWSKTYGGTGEDGGTSVQQTTDGGYVIAGYTKSFGAGNADIYLIKTDGSGNLLWSKTFGGPGYESSYFDHLSVQQTTDGGYIIASSTTSFGSGADHVYLIKTDSLGNSGCNEGNPATITTSPVTPVTTQPASVMINGAANIPLITTIGGGSVVTTLCIITGTDEIRGNVPNNSISIFPNPFSNSTTISFSLSQSQKISLKIFDVNGRLIKTLADKIIFEDGEHEIEFNAEKLNAGIYFLKMQAGEFLKTEKLIVTKQ